MAGRAGKVRGLVRCRQRRAVLSKSFGVERRVEKTRTVRGVKRRVAFDVTRDVESYPHFMPFVVATSILERSEHAVVADITFEHSRLPRETIRHTIEWEEDDTASTLVSCAKDASLCDKIEYKWQFQDAESGENDCVVSLDLALEFNAYPTAVLFDLFADAVVEKVMGAMLDRCEKNM